MHACMRVCVCVCVCVCDTLSPGGPTCVARWHGQVTGPQQQRQQLASRVIPPAADICVGKKKVRPQRDDSPPPFFHFFRNRGERRGRGTGNSPGLISSCDESCRGCVSGGGRRGDWENLGRIVGSWAIWRRIALVSIFTAGPYIWERSKKHPLRSF